MWDAKKATSRLTVGGLSSCVRDLAFSPDGRMIGSTGRNDGLVSLRDAGTGLEVVRLVGHNGVVRGIAFSPRRRQPGDRRGRPINQIVGRAQVRAVPVSVNDALKGNPTGVRDEARRAVLDRHDLRRPGRVVRGSLRRRRSEGGPGATETGGPWLLGERCQTACR